jgi:hypothetical protein
MASKLLFGISLVALSLTQLAAGGTWSPAAHTWGGSSSDNAVAVTLDSSGNVYVAGSTGSFGAGGQDVLITKYSPTGQFLWAKTWGGSSDDFATAVKIGPDGFLYVTGLTSSFGAGWFDLFLLQLDSNGNLIWGTTWGGASYDGGHDIGFDANGNIYVVGESYSTGPCCTAVLLKFSTTGALLQSSYYKGPATYDSGYSLAVDSSFNVIVTGISWDYSISPLHNSILLLKYDPNGNLLWQQNWSTAFPGQDESWAFHDVTTDTANNIYIGGRHSSNCDNSNFGQCDFDSLLIKLDQSGNFQWADTWGTAGTYDTAGSVLLTAGQTPMVAGMLDQYGTPLLFLLGYDASGNLLSETGWQGGNVQQGSAAGMASDASGALYLASSALNNQGSWGATSANSGTLGNSLISNSYSAGIPALSTTSLTTPTVVQSSGVLNTGGGGGDAFIAQLAPSTTAPQTIPFWTGSFIYANQPYSYRMVGTSPYKGSATTTVAAEILPMNLSVDGVSFDGSDEAQSIANSPLFVNATFGADQTQYADAMQRAEFWNPLITKTSPNYHVLLGVPTISPSVLVDVPAPEGEICISGSGTMYAIVLRSWLQNRKLDPTILPDQNYDPSSLAIVLTHNVVLFEGPELPSCSGATVDGGYHWALPTHGGSQINTYVWGSFLDAGISATSGEEDIFFLSHEIAEWMNDPFVNLTTGTLRQNVVPNWQQPGSSTLICNYTMEVGDATEDLSPAFEVQGTTYHVTDVAGISWFAHESPSMEEGSTKSKPFYSYTGEINTLPATCNRVAGGRLVH